MGLLVVTLFHPSVLRRPRAAVVWLGIWILTIATRIPFQEQPVVMMSIRHVAQLTQLLVLLWLASNVLRSRQVLHTTLIIIVCAGALLAVVQVVAPTGITDDGRTSTLGENPNTIGTLLAVALVAGIGVIHEVVRGWTRLVIGVLMVPILIQLIRTGSRGALLALICGVLGMVVMSSEIGGKLRALLLAIPLLAAIAYVVSIDVSMRERVAVSVEEQDFARREIIIPLTLDMIAERPIAGWGPEQHLIELGSRMSRDIMDEHNLYLWVLNEGGVIAFVPFMIGAWLAFRGARDARACRRGVIVLGLFATIAAANLGHSQHNRKITWVVLAMAVGTPDLRKRERQHPAAAVRSRAAAR